MAPGSKLAIATKIARSGPFKGILTDPRNFNVPGITHASGIVAPRTHSDPRIQCPRTPSVPRMVRSSGTPAPGSMNAPRTGNNHIMSVHSLNDNFVGPAYLVYPVI